MADFELGQVPDHDVGAPFLKLFALARPVYPDNQLELAPVPGLDTGQRILHDDRLLRLDTQLFGRLQEDCRVGFPFQAKFIRVDSIHLDIEEPPYAGCLQHFLSIAAG